MKLEKLLKPAKIYLFIAAVAIYTFVVYKLYVLNWFENAGVPTLVIVGFFLFMIPLVFSVVIKDFFKKKIVQSE